MIWFVSKQCTSCRELKEFDQFTINNDYPGGFETQCRVCKRKIYNKSLLKTKNKFKGLTPDEIKNNAGWTERCCRSCGITKNISEYSINKSKKDGISIYCKSCGIEKRNLDRNNNLQRSLDSSNRYKRIHKETVNFQTKLWRENNKDHVLNYTKERYRNNNAVRLRATVSSGLSKVLRRYLIKKTNKINVLLGCNIKFFVKYIEGKFKPGMTWKNHSNRGWHLDHTKPCAAFDLSDPEQQKLCFHYSNYQPLWCVDNESKSSVYNGIRHRHKNKKCELY